MHARATDLRPEFASRLIRWQRRRGRHDLPWQRTRDPYRVWLAEIMLQQTQVATVVPYYERFLARLPTLAALAAAPVDEVMALWSGLGYYARARNLHACARAVMRDGAGEFPRTPEALAALPGIGRSTANSIATVCFGAQAPVLDGNVKRVLCRVFSIAGWPGSGEVGKRLWALAEELMPATRGDIYNQAQMDLGATVCTRAKPRCAACPLADGCSALAGGRVAELPQAKPRKTLPERAANLLAVFDAGGRVLVETRPPAGIWGGLQSLPELPAGEDAASWLPRRFGMRAVAVSPAPTFVHVFSHVRWRIAPLVCRVRGTRTATEPGVAWLGRHDLAGAALPAPVRTLLLQLAGSSPLSSRKR